MSSRCSPSQQTWSIQRPASSAKPLLKSKFYGAFREMPSGDASTSIAGKFDTRESEREREKEREKERKRGVRTVKGQAQTSLNVPASS